MDSVIREYEVRSRADGNKLVNAFQLAGYLVKFMLTARQGRKPLPEQSYYQVWSDGTVTWDVTPLDMPEVKSGDYSLIAFDKSVIIKPLIVAK